MKRSIFILAFFAAGCARELTAPLNSVPVTSMAEYFWTSGTKEILDSDRIATRDSNGTLLVNDSTPKGTLRTTLLCHVSADSVFAERFTMGSLIDLDKDMRFISTDASGSTHDGGIVLLRRNPLIDSSWSAGTIMEGSSGNYRKIPIEARFLARLDTLIVGSVSYPDVLIVRYAYEKPNFSADTTEPYWVIFYARGRGPIMFDKFDSSAFERRAILP